MVLVLLGFVLLWLAVFTAISLYFVVYIFKRFDAITGHIERMTTEASSSAPATPPSTAGAAMAGPAGPGMEQPSAAPAAALDNL